MVTSQAVVFEVLPFFSRAGSESRAALSLYRSRLDKRYSLADCLAMVICRERGITEILSTDHDFEAEGFTILLKH